jgi:hypothetical protein
MGTLNKCPPHVKCCDGFVPNPTIAQVMGILIFILELEKPSC